MAVEKAVMFKAAAPCDRGSVVTMGRIPRCGLLPLRHGARPGVKQAVEVDDRSVPSSSVNLMKFVCWYTI